VTNTGLRTGDAVPQVYIGEENPRIVRPVKELKGFARVELKPGQTQTVTIPLTDRSFAFYDSDSKSWRSDKGAYDVLVGSSSQKIELKASVTWR